MKKFIVFCAGAVLTAGFIMGGCNPSKVEGSEFVKKQYVGKYTMPDESSEHEGTWLQWPHSFTYGKGYVEKIEPIWIEMTAALSEGENVHIIAYDEYEKNYIYDLLAIYQDQNCKSRKI